MTKKFGNILYLSEPVKDNASKSTLLFHSEHIFSYDCEVFTAHFVYKTCLTNEAEKYFF